MSDCRDWTRIANPGQSVGWRCNTHGDGPYVGDSSPYLCRVGRAEETERILQDLIAELRDMGGEYDSGWAPLIPVADRAESRLREVQGE